MSPSCLHPSPSTMQEKRCKRLSRMVSRSIFFDNKYTV
jgi:hypothetical protein